MIHDSTFICICLQAWTWTTCASDPQTYISDSIKPPRLAPTPCPSETRLNDIPALDGRVAFQCGFAGLESCTRNGPSKAKRYVRQRFVPFAYCTRHNSAFETLWPDGADFTYWYLNFALAGYVCATRRVRRVVHSTPCVCSNPARKSERGFIRPESTTLSP